ncbi:hypothetical protein Snoj_04220 [Streptomyces nojiriensis]|uniref:Uncharacterized protein n=1 Tax=Streptomyces nojiriensis TaxID=66374 RepID=A0ABQ3SEF1_9ACTN|nr:hypothetical protein [Streptomyces nojiriensis]QTI48155.1 hypothetical protein JYK04_06015 [Streptomyces nojiriensis]GGS25756.1 hypothetical protein GCM10010205_64690 [Streptomyces nojiriensis]GHI66504.1 hypothetical protein Snoj_04220 [Streptomyces nojiriensis]
MTIVPLGNNRPERRPRTRAEKHELRVAELRADVAHINAQTAAEVELIRAAGRAQLHLERARFTRTLTGEVAEQYEALHREIARIQQSNPDDLGLALGLAEILDEGRQALRSVIQDHVRDGRRLS